MAEPSTHWNEDIAPDEEAVFAALTRRLVAVQRSKDALHGKGRALHRKATAAAPAVFEVLDDLPPHARAGLFAEPARYAAIVRLSNGSHSIAPDAKPDVRGFAIRVTGVHGPSALGGAPTDAQSFLLITQSSFPFPTPESFVDLTEGGAKGKLSLLFRVFKNFGFGGFGFLRTLGRELGRPFSGFAGERFHSAVPIACGDYACRVRLVPTHDVAGDPPTTDADVDWGRDFLARLAKGDLRFDVQLQFFVDEAITPIEDPTVDWPEAAAPYTTVARLIIERSSLDRATDPGFAASVEKMTFDPWNALAAHRPLGRIMRARKPAYHGSHQNRA